MTFLINSVLIEDLIDSIKSNMSISHSDDGWVRKCNYCDGKNNEPSHKIKHEENCEGKLLIHRLRMLKPKRGMGYEDLD